MALTRLAERPDVAINPSEATLAAWLRHHDPWVRRAAILNTAAPFAWTTLLALATADVDAVVRAAATRRLASDFSSRSLPRLLDALADADWQERAAAVEGLASLGPGDVSAAVRPLVDDARLPVRVAAVNVLLRLDEDAWLAEHLLGVARQNVS
jgi:HEAT repeat protein